MLRAIVFRRRMLSVPDRLWLLFRTSGASVVALLLSAVAVGIVVPYSLWVSSRGNTELTGAKLAALQTITKQQTELLHTILGLQERLAQVQALTDSLGDKRAKWAATANSTAVFEADLADMKLKMKEKSSDIMKYMKASLTELEAENEKEIQRVRDAWSTRTHRFLVKWHGDDGVKTSKRMGSEGESLDFFNQVGDFAKKLLMFDGTNWLVLKQYGGQEWLNLMQDNGVVQDGDGKPTKRPKKDSESEN